MLDLGLSRSAEPGREGFLPGRVRGRAPIRDVAGPVIPGRNFSTSLSSPTSLSAHPGTSGQGPTKLLLPMSALRRLADATRSFFRADGNHWGIICAFKLCGFRQLLINQPLRQLHRVRCVDT